MSNDLAVIEISDDLAPTLYVENGLEKLLKQIREQVKEVPDLSTKKGRDRIASLAAQVSRSKKAVEEPGRAYLKRLKEQPKIIEAELRRFVTECDLIRDETRKPLTDWENAEKERQETLNQRLVNLRALADVIDGTGNYLPSVDIQSRLTEAKSVELDDAWQEITAEAGVAKDATVQKLEAAFTEAKKREDEAAELERLRKDAEEKARIEREELLKKEATEKVMREAEEKSAAERKAAEKREADLKAEKERVEREAKEALERAEREKQEAVAAEQRKAKLAEEARQAEEKRKLDEQAKREANVKHRKAIGTAVVSALVEHAGLTREQAIAAYTALMNNQIPHTHITY